LVFYGEDTVDISTVHHWVKKWSGMSVVLTILTGKNMGNLFNKIKVFSESHSRKVKHWFSYSQGDYCRSGL